MNSQKETKINNLLKTCPKGVLITQEWLTKHNVYRQLANVYCKHKWLDKIARGVYKRSDEKVDWMGGLYALQKQLNLKVHVGAVNALNMQGFGHYVAAQEVQVWLFVEASETRKIPSWFHKTFGKQIKVHFIKSNLFASCESTGIKEMPVGDFSICVSSPERAIMEYLYLVPKNALLDTVSTVMEKLRTLRPEVVQHLLECCSSIKVKRLFLYLAELHNHTWLNSIDVVIINLGAGKRRIGQGGKFIEKYQISIPEIRDEGYTDEEVRF